MADFREVQRAFAGHIRDPYGVARRKDVPEPRMAVYRDLFFNNISDLLANNFPVSYSLLEDVHWPEMIRDFMVDHRCSTPLFPEVGREFLKFLEGNQKWLTLYPFLLELAHYEWVELALDISQESHEETATGLGQDMVNQRPVMSPLAWLLHYQYPVHRISPDFIPEQAGEMVHLVVYRDRADEVHFMELNPMTAALLQTLLEHPEMNGQELIGHLAAVTAYPDPEALLEAGQAILQDMFERSILIGSRGEEA